MHFADNIKKTFYRTTIHGMIILLTWDCSMR